MYILYLHVLEMRFLETPHSDLFGYGNKLKILLHKGQGAILLHKICIYKVSNFEMLFDNNMYMYIYANVDSSDHYIDI